VLVETCFGIVTSYCRNSVQNFAPHIISHFWLFCASLNIYFISLYCFLSVQYLNYISVFQLIALNIFYKQHIKTYVLSKTLKISPTCFGHLATILRETQYLSLLQLLNYRCSSMPAGMLLHFKLYICIPTNCTQLIYFINNTLKHMYCLKL